MNHRLKFRWEPNRFSNLVLQDVWCPGDHGGECDCPEVDPEGHDDECIQILDPEESADDCDCQGKPTGKCWAKENLDLFVGESDGWSECLSGSIDLPWVAVTIDGPGPDGNDPVTVNVFAEVAP